VKAYTNIKVLNSSHEKLKKLAKKRGKPMTDVLEEILAKVLQQEPSCG
jgi:hypothetical protein